MRGIQYVSALDSTQKHELRQPFPVRPHHSVLFEQQTQHAGVLKRRRKHQKTRLAKPAIRRMYADPVDELKSTPRQFSRERHLTTLVRRNIERLAKRIAGSDKRAAEHAICRLNLTECLIRLPDSQNSRQ